MARFSKETMMNYLETRAEALREAHNFDPGNGYAQVTGKETSIIVDYGKWRTYLDLIDAIDGGYVAK